MKHFAEMISILATSTKTNAKIEALQSYFENASSEDKVWVIALFTGRRPRRTVTGALLVQWCREITELPDWLIAESYHTVGDFAEVIALLLPEKNVDATQNFSLYYYMNALISLDKKEDNIKKDFITNSWSVMTKMEKFVFNKLITGGFRIGVSQKIMVNALAKTTQVSPSIIAHRISGKWDPSTITFKELITDDGSSKDFSKPFPFYLAYAVEDVADLQEPELWQAEWKWDGIRGQIIKRNNELFVWSRGEELITEKFPEYQILQNILPDGIAIDGEIISLGPLNEFLDFTPLPFSALQTRIGRKNITKKQLTDAPVGFIAYDILEFDYQDIRSETLEKRRVILETVIQTIQQPFFHLSPKINFDSWEELKNIRVNSRDIGSEGIMLKRKSSAYQVGRKRGDWWKWKIDPLTIDAVMIYAQKGSGRRSNLYTDYTFAVKNGDELVTFAKAYSGLTDKEFAQIDAFVKRNSIEKFGPVRTVKPELVFEIAFEGIAASNRHKSGVALRFPRMSRWRKDKKPDEINTLEDLKQLLKVYGSSRALNNEKE